VWLLLHIEFWEASYVQKLPVEAEAAPYTAFHQLREHFFMGKLVRGTGACGNQLMNIGGHRHESDCA
jgi:hypothetical protein